MADTTTVTFTRPVRIDAKRYGKDSKPASIDADIAAQLIELGAAKEAEPATAKKA